MQDFILKLYAGIEVLKSVVKEDNGQDLVEYALVLGLIAMGSVAAVQGLAASIGTALASVDTKLTSATS